MDIRFFAGAGALMLALAACGQNDRDAIMGQGANALTPEQVDAALGPELGNAADLPGNDLPQIGPAEESEAVEAADAAEPPRPARPERAESPANADDPEPPEAAPAPVGDNNSE